MIASNFLKIIRGVRVAVRQCSTEIIQEKKTPDSVVPHIPVLAEETLEYLNLNDNKTILDMTFGAGGHTRKILDSFPSVKVVALDRDPIAFSHANKMSDEYPGRLTPLLGRFSDLPELLQAKNIPPKTFDGILFDFGCSSMQFDEAERGFSLSKNGPLDMRMDKDRDPDAPTAADILANIEEPDLARILRIYGEEKNAKKIARVIIATRHTYRRLYTTKELADLVKSCYNDEHRLDKLQRHSHAATKTFQALRIFVNNELNEINYGLTISDKLLKVGGKLVTITFHSLEDTIVKRHIMGNVIDNAANPTPLKYASHTLMHDQELIDSLMQSNWKQIHKHVITPSLKELELNPRSRSAKLRAAVKIS